mgnify:CR=1 FL=1
MLRLASPLHWAIAILDEIWAENWVCRDQAITHFMSLSSWNFKFLSPKTPSIHSFYFLNLSSECLTFSLSSKISSTHSKNFQFFSRHHLRFFMYQKYQLFSRHTHQAVTQFLTVKKVSYFHNTHIKPLLILLSAKNVNTWLVSNFW